MCKNILVTDKMDTVCVHFKYGYCKFGEKCRKYHNTIICHDESCEERTCQKRHPKKCHYFQRYSMCKFGDYCLYDHEERGHSSTENREDSKYNDLIAEVDALKKVVKELEEIVKNLTSKVNLNSHSTLNIDADGCILLECDQCGRTFRTKNGLTKHTTIHEGIPQVDGNITVNSESDESIINEESEEKLM